MTMLSRNEPFSPTQWPHFLTITSRSQPLRRFLRNDWPLILSSSQHLSLSASWIPSIETGQIWIGTNTMVASTPPEDPRSSLTPHPSRTKSPGLINLNQTSLTAMATMINSRNIALLQSRLDHHEVALHTLHERVEVQNAVIGCLVRMVGVLRERLLVSEQTVKKMAAVLKVAGVHLVMVRMAVRSSPAYREGLLQIASSQIWKLKGWLLASLFCHGALKWGQIYTAQEMASLLLLGTVLPPKMIRRMQLAAESLAGMTVTMSPGMAAGLEDFTRVGCPVEHLQIHNALEIFTEYLSTGTICKDSALGTACVLAFVQANWTGPYLPESFPDPSHGECVKKLQMGGEAVYPLVRYPWLLVLAKECLDGWWLLRALHLNQRLLDSPSSELVEMMEVLITANVSKLGELTAGESCVEAALIAQTNGNQKLSEDLIEAACKYSGFRHHLTGILGRRTKFQSFDVTQLAVKVEESAPRDLPKGSETTGPANIELQDEYLLDRPDLNEPLSGKISETGLAIIMAEAMHVLRFYAKDATVIEKAMALVQCVLEHPGNWCIYSSALFLRSSLESSRARFVERAALQYQALVDQMKDTKVPFEDRVHCLFATPLPPDWELDRHQARLFAGLGVFRTASVIFERRAMWDEYISCLIQIGERTKAEELLNEKIEKDPLNVKMLCILGDLKDDHTLYQKAWEVSNKRFARAMRSLGMYYFKKEMIPEAIEAFESALALNALFDKIWFLVGCAALQLEDFKKARNAFSRTVGIDPENSEAWNNLAAVYLYSGQQEEALRALKEAGKRKFDNWKIWDNIFRVSLSLGEITEAIAAYRRVAEIRGKETDLGNLDYIFETLKSAITLRQMLDCVKRIRSTLDRCKSAVDVDFHERECQLKSIVENIIRRGQPTMSATPEFVELRSLL
ncbi:hypothetical protein PSACC_02794 [Paramicrosporidium saccamoebae]|uniref:Uncharacterized protein n=1 Tax=Paramicrosporidium saccamoebae TaxID=1246581 RepID=A0A2H9THY0_9FUNG|nr:hypothetical protein PSACC_02794 [Paramicrosporidium saccamoebae]